MTVCTNNLALADLAEYGLPVSTPQPGGDSEFLAGQVIELQDHRVCLPAIDAGMLAEKCNEEQHSLGDESLFPTPRGGDVPLTVGEIVFAFVSGSAWTAIGVALRQRLSTPGRRTHGLDLTAPAAPVVGAGIRHEHMFP